MAEKIKIRWKEGIGLFVLLVFSGLYFFGTPDLYGILDYKYEHYYEDIITFFFRVVLPIPFLVSVFLYSLYKTEKRAKEGMFSFWKLLIFSLAVSLMAGFLWILQFVTGSGYGYSKQDVVKQLIFSDVWVFPAGSMASMILVFIFSLVPSLLLYKFYLKPKKLHVAIASFFVFLFLGLFVYQQAGVLTCGFNHDSYCVANRALKTKNISLCEKVKISKETGDYGKNYCYVVVSKKWDNIGLCDKIKIGADKKTKNPPHGQYQTYQCISYIAKNTKNKELCEKIPISRFKDIELIREKCFNDSKEKPKADLNNWKIYRNEEYEFEFRYPKEYFISLPPYTTVNEATGVFDSDPQEELLNKDLIIDNTRSITVWVNINRIDSLPIEPTREKDDPLQDTTQKDLIAQRAEIENSKIFNSDYVAENKNSITKIIKIGDKKLKRSIWYSHQSGDFINTLEFFSKEGDLITIESYLLKAKNIEEAKNDPYTNIFDAILSTFKFTE